MSEPPTLKGKTLEEASVAAGHNLLRILGSAVKPLEDLSKKMSDSKFIKGLKELGKTMKSMIDASFKGWIISNLMSLIEPFLNLLKMFNPLFAVLAAIIQTMLLPIVKILTPWIVALAQWLWKMKDFVALLVPVILILVGILGGPFLAIILGVIAVIALMITHWETIWKVMTAVADFLYKGFITVFEVILGKIKDFVNGIIKIVRAFIGVLNKIPGVNIKKPKYLAEGGILMGPTAIGGEKGPEAVIPLNDPRAKRMIGGMSAIVEDAILQTAKNTAFLVKDKQVAKSGLVRRRFG